MIKIVPIETLKKNVHNCLYMKKKSKIDNLDLS